MDNDDVLNDNVQYRAVSNMNTAIENPEFNVNNAMGVNIEDVPQNSISGSDFDNVDDSSFSDDSIYQSNIVNDVESSNISGEEPNVISNEGEYINSYTSNGYSSSSGNNGFVEGNQNANSSSNVANKYVASFLNDTNGSDSSVNDNYMISNMSNDYVVSADDSVDESNKSDIVSDGNNYINNNVDSDYNGNVQNDVVESASQSFVSNEDNVSYEPVNYEKSLKTNENKKDSKFTIPKDFKIIIFIALVLAIFILLMPYVYDFFKDLGFVVTSK